MKLKREHRAANLFEESGICLHCGTALSKDNWWPSCYTAQYNICISCNKAKQSRHWAQVREREVRKWQTKKYGLSLQELEQLERKQDGKCAICSSKNSFNGKLHRHHNLSVDHNHKTGKVRGLLCDRCNRSLGLLKDDPNLLKSAFEYLLRNGQ